MGEASRLITNTLHLCVTVNSSSNWETPPSLTRTSETQQAQDNSHKKATTKSEYDGLDSI